MGGLYHCQYLNYYASPHIWKTVGSWVKCKYYVLGLCGSL